MVDDNIVSLVTPSKPLSDKAWVAKPSELSHVDGSHSSTKLRKVIKEHEDWRFYVLEYKVGQLKFVASVMVLL